MATYPRIHTDADRAKPLMQQLTLLVTYHEGGEELRVCGESWCDGACGLPALVIPASDGFAERKAYSSMVAHGPVFQSWRLIWKGPKVEVPTQHWADFAKRYWR